MPRAAAVILASLALAAVLCGRAEAGGGNYVFDGGTPAERAQVVAALEASAFDWSLVTRRVTIHVRKGVASEATPGEIWLDADLLRTRRFAWGTIQHEYAHQVDYFLLSEDDRETLNARFGTPDWCYGVPGLPHEEYGCERFASTLAWAYWPSPQNALRPDSAAAVIEPATFRALLGRMLPV
jgi:hypothetical protein